MITHGPILFSEAPAFDTRFAGWWVWVAIRFPHGGFSKWRWMPFHVAQRWGNNQAGAYASMQLYPEQHPKGSAKGKVHASLFWLEFDGTDLAESCRGAELAIQRCRRDFPEFDGAAGRERFDIRYSGNRSIHLGLDLGVGLVKDPSEGLTRAHKAAARAWHDEGSAPHADLGIYTEPRLLSIPNSIRFNAARRIIRLTPDDVRDGVLSPDRIIENSAVPRR